MNFFVIVCYDGPYILNETYFNVILIGIQIFFINKKHLFDLIDKHEMNLKFNLNCLEWEFV